MIALGWMQLKHQQLRLLVAVLGISFAVVLILMQVGFREALFQSAVRYHQRFDFDVAIFGAESTFIVRPQSFSKRRLYQALGMDGVESVSPVYIAPANWKNPYNHQVRSILTLGVDPDRTVLNAPGVREGLERTRLQDAVLFDDAREVAAVSPFALRLFGRARKKARRMRWRPTK